MSDRVAIECVIIELLCVANSKQKNRSLERGFTFGAALFVLVEN